MNTKIKKYVDSLFSSVPYSQKAQELKDEIMADMEAHFNDQINLGASETEAFRTAVDNLGDMEEIIKGLIPERELQDKIDAYKKKRALRTSISVMLFIIGPSVLIGMSSLSALLGFRPDIAAVLGLILMFVFAAVGVGMLIYTKMSTPQDVLPYIRKTHNRFDETTWDIDTNSRNGRILKSFLSSHFMICLALYFIISFASGDWHITWVIFLVDFAVEKAVRALLED